MVKTIIDYQGQLRCSAIHSPSNTKLQTDAPVDNNGKGESYSPTDLVATALGSCMATVMGIAAERKKIDLTGLRIIVKKEMSKELPRRIIRLEVTISMPISQDHSEAKILQSTARGCPVQQSLHPRIEVPITWEWKN